MTSLIVEEKPKSYVSEAYRTLRTNLQFSYFDKDLKKILITSAGPGEGKSTTAINLALTMAQAGNRVILIDCDLRKPTLHKKFKISNRFGLSNLIAENLKLADVIVQHNPNFFIVPSGVIPPNPSEMLASYKMKEFLESLQSIFDCIILDTPPVLPVTDAQVLSTMVDGVIITTAAEQTSKDALIKTKELLDNVNANILGVVLNKVKIRSGKKNGYYYYYEYK